MKFVCLNEKYSVWLTDEQQVTAEPQGGNVPQPMIYIPTTGGVFEGGTILLQLTEDGKLILPPGLAAIQPPNQSGEFTTISQAL